MNMMIQMQTVTCKLSYMRAFDIIRKYWSKALRNYVTFQCK